ncbi:hypothetical protein FRACYDRAFT_245973 [Fragilariopsis cylindrus CCMP1102]|uniref:Uncharacterized protein n=1 Tax=Fragilariopsis cylindrus CCMP1102 TaxID=635003 RepID=A0A1E7EZH3_9STRA|nr:hypothetical protein FRACYDRAFT_245973 [Fragilariopsis cylindrus CCMP1102]|eukprot:OEU11420.1 hypothetical protein FRACYDRAFT_245973 [Fragilariopsis cylindrus CCMP1102]
MYKLKNEAWTLLLTIGCISIKGLGRLAQTNKVMKTAVIDDEAIWVSLYKQMNGVEYGIPKEILDKVGLMWLVIQMQKKSPPARSLAPPTHTENDLVLIGEMSYNSDKENNISHKVTRRFSITGEDLKHFLNTGNIDVNFYEPIIVADAEMISRKYAMLIESNKFDDYDKRREVGPTDIRWRKNIDFQARLLRLGNMKSCCCCFFDPEFPEFMPEEWHYPSLRPLDLSLNPSNWNNNDIDKLDFGRGKEKGRIDISGFFAEKGLPLQDSVQAKEIKARFPHRFCFGASFWFDVSLNKKIVITGLSIFALKACIFNDNSTILFEDEGRGEDEEDEEEGNSNNGVTVAHILSELYCPEV